MKYASFLAVALVVFASPLFGSERSLPETALQADIIFLGENHDNPTHHAVQAQWVAALRPTALVFEMLTKAQAAKAIYGIRQDKDALGAALAWEASGWPPFDLYYPIFEAAPMADVFGAAVPREQLPELMTLTLDQIAPSDVITLFGLDQPLEAAQQEKRLSLQDEAHCNMLPEEFLQGMVRVQRLRDATLAHAALNAVDEHGAPVVVITGNGHARKDWGAPFMLYHARPDLVIYALGQGEEDTSPPGAFDLVLSAPGVAREDPCSAFR